MKVSEIPLVLAGYIIADYGEKKSAHAVYVRADHPNPEWLDVVIRKERNTRREAER